MLRVKIRFVKTDGKIRRRKFELPILSIRYINFFLGGRFCHRVESGEIGGVCLANVVGPRGGGGCGSAFTFAAACRNCIWESEEHHLLCAGRRAASFCCVRFIERGGGGGVDSFGFLPQWTARRRHAKLAPRSHAHAAQRGEKNINSQQIGHRRAMDFFLLFY